jgi:inosine-uridine nucleoside N-ribohydrolase
MTVYNDMQQKSAQLWASTPDNNLLRLAEAEQLQLSQAGFIHAEPSDTTPDVWMIVDTGIDDAVGIWAMLRNRLKSIIRGITTTAGNALGDNVFNNTRNVLYAAGENIPVYRGSDAPLDRDELLETAAGAHGESGLGDVQLDMSPAPHTNTKGHEALADAILNGNKPLDIISTASLTDIYKALKHVENKAGMVDVSGCATEAEANDLRREAIKSAMKKGLNAIYMMGGVLNPHQANAPFGNNYTEFNIFTDPKAAHEVFAMAKSYDIPIVLAPLDLTHVIPFTCEDADVLERMGKEGNKIAEHIAHFVGRPQPWDQARYPQELMGDAFPAMPMHDLITVMSRERPDLFKARRVNMTVDGNDAAQPGLCKITDVTDGNVYVLEMDPEKIPELKAAFFKLISLLNADQTLGNKATGTAPNTDIQRYG